MSPESPIGYPLKQRLKDIALCLSLANLLWLEPWRLALGIRWNPFFFSQGTHVHLISAVVGVLLTALLLFAGLIATQTVERLRSIGTWSFFVVCAVAANTIRIQIPAVTTPSLVSTFGATGLAILSVFSSIGLFYIAAFQTRRVVHVLKIVVLTLGPFSVYTFFEAGEAAVAEFQVPATEPSRVLADPRPGPRVVVVLFDEMDRANVGLGTPAAANLPALSNLAREAVDFRSAVAPLDAQTTTARTLISLPSITTGRTVVASDPSGPSDTQIRFSNGEERLWSEPQNFFRIARSEGVDAFLAGWFIPYCRMFAADVSSCSWRPSYPLRPESITASLRLYAPLFWRSIPGLNRASLWLGWRDQESLGLAWHMESYREVQARALEGVRDPRYRLVFVHYPIPHLSSDFRGSVIGNQILADQALGEVRAAMEADGSWDQTAVIVMSDHGYRAFPGLRHPVLLVKPPLSSGAASVTEPVRLERVFHLVLGLLRGEVRTAGDVVAVVSATE